MSRLSAASGDSTFSGFGGALFSLAPAALVRSSDAAPSSRPRREGPNPRLDFCGHISHIGNSAQRVCTSTTPDTALIAPAICGETLKRPGSFISTSVSRSSINTSDTSPSDPLPGLGQLQALGDGFQRPCVTDENPKTLLGLGRGIIQRLGMEHAGADVLA